VQPARMTRPSCLEATHSRSVADTKEFDAAIHKKIGLLSHKLDGISAVVGVPYYNELSNVISVIVTMREVFQQRKLNVLIVVLGEFDRSDLVELINAEEIEEGEGNDEPYVRIETFWKPAPKFKFKPWSVRCFQLMAAAANKGAGTHVLVVDADVQFNHWELSAHSLINTLLGPLLAHDSQSEEGSGDLQLGPVSIPACPHPALAVCLNAPRSFHADDGLVHAFSFLMVYAMLGVEVHQIHGGEFSIHSSLNKALLADATLVHHDTYCLQEQVTVRALTGVGDCPAGDVAEFLMKGKWHAKISLSKLVNPCTPDGRSKLHLVAERLFGEALLLQSEKINTCEGKMVGCLGGLSVRQDPDPQLQTMRVLAPPAARREMLHTLKAFFTDLLVAHLTEGHVHLPVSSVFVQTTVPLLHIACRKDIGRGYLHILPAAPEGGLAAGGGALVFGPREWATNTCELLSIYAASNTLVKSSPDLSFRGGSLQERADLVRRAAVTATCLVWLLATIAFLNRQCRGTWGDMNAALKSDYMHIFRETYLANFFPQGN